MITKTRHPLIDELVNIQARDGLTGMEMSRRLDIVASSYTRLVSGEMQPSLRVVQSVNRAFPELRSHCVQLLQISNANTADLQEAAS